VAWIQDPTHVHVVHPHSILAQTYDRDRNIPVPLTTIPIKCLSTTFTRDTDDKRVDIAALYEVIRSVLNAKPEARTTYVH
jgi:hypothetical protein